MAHQHAPAVPVKHKKGFSSLCSFHQLICSGFLSASEDSVLENPGVSADHATGRSLQEVHRAAGQ